MRKLLLLSLLAMLSLTALKCKKDPTSPSDPFNSFDRKAMLRNLGENIILPGYREFKTQTSALSTAFDQFSANPTQTTLDTVQAAWLRMAKSWKRVEMIKMGPTDEAAGNLAAIDLGAINSMRIGTPVDKTAIEGVISGSAALDDAYIENLPADNKGIFALDYLLYRRSGDATILQEYAGTGAQRRIAYTKALIKNLDAKAQTLVTAWEPAGGNYLNTFINADGRDIGSSIGMMTNDMVYVVEMVKNEKLGRPLGMRTSGQLQPTVVEARESGQSWALIEANMQGTKALFLGNSAKGNLSGYDDLLKAMNAKFGDLPLEQVIATQIDVLAAKAANAPGTLEDLTSSDKAYVQAAYEEAKKLTVLMKVDMVNNLGVVLTYTDNDGD